MTAPEDRRDEARIEQTLTEEERAAGAYVPESADSPNPEEEGVPDFEPDEDLAAGPPDGR